MTDSRHPGPSTIEAPPGPAETGIDRIVVGFDASPSSARASRLALALATPRAGRIWFVHASDTDRRIAEPLTEEEIAVPSRAILRTMELLVAEAKGRELQALALTQEGPPGEVLQRVARGVDAGLILVGTRGRHDPRRVRLGSVSGHLVAHAHIPVLVVP